MNSDDHKWLRAIELHALELQEVVIDALIYARETGGDGEAWYTFGVSALEKCGLDEFGNELPNRRKRGSKLEPN